MPTVTFTLNGRKTTAPYEEGMHFLEVLREECGIVSAKDGCSPEGSCGCCTVLVDGRPALACLKKPRDLEGREVVTLEGLPEGLREVLARAFVQEGAIQCGYCTPGMILTAKALLDQCPRPSEEEIRLGIAGNLCRCTGYAKIVEAIQMVVETAEGE